jgi:hypothetical protein
MATSYQFCPVCHKLKFLQETTVFPLITTGNVTVTEVSSTEPVFFPQATTTATQGIFPLQVEFCTCTPLK